MVITHKEKNFENILIQTLLQGNVAVVQCDTIYGFIGIAPDTESLLHKIKGRSKGKPYLQLIADKRWLRMFSDFNVPSELEEFWPGPLTLIIPSRDGSSVGVRAPDDLFLQKILTKIQKPLFSTSVNRQGNEPMGRIKDIIKEFENDVALIIDSGDLGGNAIPSTILDVTSKPFKIIRQGSLVIPEHILTG